MSGASRRRHGAPPGAGPRSLRLALALSAALFALAAAAAGEPAPEAGDGRAGEGAPAGPAAADAAARDAPGASDAGEAADAGANPCGAELARLEHRRAWLAARRQEQFERGGLPDPSRAISNAFGVWCEAHPGDEECALGSISITASPEEFSFEPDATTDDYEPHVILMKRELAACRQAARGWR